MKRFMARSGPSFEDALHGVGGPLHRLVDGLSVLPLELAQHPVGHVVVGVGLLAHAHLDPGELVGAQVLDDVLQAVVPPGGAPLVRMRSLPTARDTSSEITSTRSGGIL